MKYPQHIGSAALTPVDVHGHRANERCNGNAFVQVPFVLHNCLLGGKGGYAETDKQHRDGSLRNGWLLGQMEVDRLRNARKMSNRHGYHQKN